MFACTKVAAADIGTLFCIYAAAADKTGQRMHESVQTRADWHARAYEEEGT